MRILHAASSYPLNSEDGTAPFMEEMLGALANRNHQVDVIVPQIRGLQTGPRHGVSVSGFRYAPSPLQVWGYGRSFTSRGRIRPLAIAISPIALTAMYQTLRRKVREEKPDVVHLHWIAPQGLLGLGLPRSQALVLSLHGADARFFSGPLRPVLAKTLQRTDAVVAASSRILDRAIDLVPEVSGRSFVIPHGSNDSLFGGPSKDESRSRLGLDKHRQVVLGVGRLVPKKGFGQLIRALDLIGSDTADLYIVGSGPEEATLRGSISRVKQERIQLVGAKGRSEMAEWLSACDVVVIPSAPHRGEVDSGPVVLMEAMASGKPVVSTTVGMADDVIEPGINGYLVDSNEPERLAVAIVDALEHADQLGRGARETFDRIGNWDRVAAQLEDVYEEALRRRMHLAPK